MDRSCVGHEGSGTGPALGKHFNAGVSVPLQPFSLPWDRWDFYFPFGFY